MEAKSKIGVADELRDIIHLLKPLTHDELRDLVDMLYADLNPLYPPARRGITPVNTSDGHSLILNGGWQYRDEPPLYTKAARRELVSAYKSTGTLTDDFQRVVIDIAHLVFSAHAPIPERRITPDNTPLANGSIQTKIIRRKVLNPDTGEMESMPFGPYLYYRYLASGGDYDKGKKRLKNRYIGKKELALVYHRTSPGSVERRELEARIIEAMKSGTLDSL